MPDPSTDEYAAALAFLYGRINYERTATVPYCPRELNLIQMRWLLGRIENPHFHLPIVHIAGTKGKGSTAAMISAALVAAGYRVGLYTSPHLSELEERFAVNGESCSRQELVELTRTLQDVLLSRDLSGSDVRAGLTFFDITTAMGLLHFVRRQVDIVVLEVGMGGRLDSTNVCQPLVSVITSISFDHTKQLGNTLSAIAGEKGGIIKPGVPVVSGVVDPEPSVVIARIARERGCRLFQRDREFFADYQPAPVGGPGAVSFRENPDVSNWKLEAVSLGMLGRHQAMNAGVALATLSRLRSLGWVIEDEDCRRGLAAARCPARIEVVSQNPTVIIDTAHNDASIKALTATLNECFRPSPRVLIFAVARDKDVAGMLRQLLPEFNDVILTQFTTNPRGLPITDLSALAGGVLSELSLSNVTLHSAPTPRNAWQKWLAVATPDSLVCVTGSFFLAAELTQVLSAFQTPGPKIALRQ